MASQKLIELVKQLNSVLAKYGKGKLFSNVGIEGFVVERNQVCISCVPFPVDDGTRKSFYVQEENGIEVAVFGRDSEPNELFYPKPISPSPIGSNPDLERILTGWIRKNSVLSNPDYVNQFVDWQNPGYARRIYPNKDDLANAMVFVNGEITYKIDIDNLAIYLVPWSDDPCPSYEGKFALDGKGAVCIINIGLRK